MSKKDHLFTCERCGSKVTMVIDGLCYVCHDGSNWMKVLQKDYFEILKADLVPNCSAHPIWVLSK